MSRTNKKVFGINAEGEKKEFASINEAAKFLGTNFYAVQVALMRNGICKGWRMYESPEALRERIAILEEQIKTLEG